MDFPFVAAKYFTRSGMNEARAILWHMAEGFGTVSWLTHPSNNNSCHFVIEKSGRIVQMVRLADASHSAHIAFDDDDRDANDFGIYSPFVAKQVLGNGWFNINAYVIAVEIEGFRADGPNDAQKKSIVELKSYLFGRVATLRGNLGHRDVQDYKSCPGGKFPWDSIGGHGLVGTNEPKETDDLIDYEVLDADLGGLITTPATAIQAIPIEGGARPNVPPGITRPVLGLFRIPPLGTDKEFYCMKVGDQLCFINAAQVTFKSYYPAGDSELELTNAKKALADANAALTEAGRRITTIKSKVASNAADIAND